MRGVEQDEKMMIVIMMMMSVVLSKSLLYPHWLNHRMNRIAVVVACPQRIQQQRKYRKQLRKLMTPCL